MISNILIQIPTPNLEDVRDLRTALLAAIGFLTIALVYLYVNKEKKVDKVRKEKDEAIAYIQGQKDTAIAVIQAQKDEAIKNKDELLMQVIREHEDDVKKYYADTEKFLDRYNNMFNEIKTILYDIKKT